MKSKTLTFTVDEKAEPEQIAQGIISLLVSGAERFLTAGELLVAARQKHPNIYKDIIAMAPWLTADFLDTLERVGRRMIYQNVLLLPPAVAGRIIGYRYDDQKQICEKGVEVLLYVKDGKAFRQTKPLNSLTHSERLLALGLNRPRTIDEQVQWLPSTRKAAKPRYGNSHNAPPSSLMSTFTPSIETGKMDKPPVTTPVSLVAKPQDLICIGRWVVRQGIGNNCGFERTSATGLNPVRIILDDGICVIEVCKRKA